jgi:Arc/MetJ family transcription regulator
MEVMRLRTTLDLSESLLEEAREYAGTDTKTETVERGLKELIKASKRRKLLDLEGSGYGMTSEDLFESRRDE